MAHSTSQTAFATLEKSISYRGTREHWSNAYHLDIVPADSNTWAALCQAIWTLERAFLPSEVQIEYYYGHNPGTPPVLVYESDLPPLGEGGQAGSWVAAANEHATPGDTAAWMRFGTTQKNTLGKPIYLRNYYHGIYWSGSPDLMPPSQRTAMEALGAALVAGISAAGATFRRAGPRGAVAQNHTVGPYLTTRTLKHRGRRHRWSPTSAPSGYKWILTNVPAEIN